MVGKSLMEMLNTPFVVLDWIWAMVIALWYVGSDLAIGNFYAIMGLTAPTALFMIIFFIRETELRGVIPFPYKILNIWASATLFFFGFMVAFVGGLFKLTQYFLSPFALYSQQAFASFVAIGDAQAQLINIGFLPPIVEEAFWVILTLVGFLVIYAILKGYGRNVKSVGSKILMWFGALSLAVATFGLFHAFNPEVYKELKQFISAMGFRTMVVLVGFGFSVMEFFIGMHMGNNLTAIITCSGQAGICNGAEIFLRGVLTTPFGILLLSYLLLRFGISIYGIVNKKFLWKQLITPT